MMPCAKLASLLTMTIYAMPYKTGLMVMTFRMMTPALIQTAVQYLQFRRCPWARVFRVGVCVINHARKP